MESFFANQKLLLQRLLLQRKPEVTFAFNLRYKILIFYETKSIKLYIPI